MFYNFIGFKTLTLREIRRFMKVYMQTLFAPLLSNMLFLGVFGTALKHRSMSIPGVEYLDFLIPGLAAMGAIMNGFQNPTSSLVIQKFQNLIQDLNSYPLSNFEKMLAYVLSGTVRGGLIGLLTFMASIPFIGFKLFSPVLFIIMLAYVAALFAGIGVILGLSIKNFEQMGFITSFILTPLVYFGGVFFEASQLPGVFSKAVQFNPIFPLVDSVRFAYLGVWQGSALFNVAYLLLLGLIVFSMAYLVFKKGIGLKE